ncbi:MAG: protein phosphatase CheZ [Alphaproteobacteria bacterium]|nr:protein phosphatase CheZ [Alphaproteobacteria bacterium]MBP9867443.1 protein phosphatase CheZ [Alphaproteobacteria bacterium]
MTNISSSAQSLASNVSSLEKEALLDGIHTLQSKLEVMERFVSRRFDEISMEINATSQQLDMAEEGMVGKIVEVMQVLSAISYSGDGSSAANTGVELESVIETTEKAANQILDAADRIANRLHTEGKWDEPGARDKLLEETKSDIQDILMACTFQDLTGQRIRKTLENLQMIEGRLSSTLEKFGVNIKPETNEVVRDSIDNHAKSQADIDALFA